MIPKGVFNRLLYNKGEIAAEIRPTILGCRRWIGIYPTQDAHLFDPLQRTTPKYVYLVLDFELKEELVDEYFGEEAKLNQRRYYVNSLNELEALLDSLKVDLTKFTFPWCCDYPL